MTLQIRPISLLQARKFVGVLHRHHGEPQGGKFAIAAEESGRIVGVVIAGRPVARHLDTGRVAEVTRLCTDGTRNACSLLYGAAARAAKAMGYERIYTYTLAFEPGSSLHAAGWCRDIETRGASWDQPGRRRTDKHQLGPKVRWVRVLNPMSVPDFPCPLRLYLDAMSQIDPIDKPQIHV
ncbi:hypothetical protein AEAC466_04485 [Asticcacaulis sp. AC466]|uniref:XF1762 family protein n=1 Tax=Asticcacaulis sp. AC466 TaxID=1282362 RepID=UPI0003C3CEAB|nr:XF1762 family protein [Asticcacaulis sp. AC466]ESQ85384.1 hypothetical protein AEAC466_04485 [Asticcacaulis sp. AC466]